jgi:PAS domain S-box-containing protein
MVRELGELVAKTQINSKVRSVRQKHDVVREELEAYKLLVESVQDYAIFWMDAEGYVQTWNKGAQKLNGYKPEDIIGKHFSKFYPQEDIDNRKPQKELEVATRLGRVEDEGWRLRKDGSRLWASVIITALHNQSGKLVGFAKVTRDLTERKLHEDELWRANVLLRAQQKELQLLNQSKDEFISLASHQLRTPATAIKQLLGLFVEGFQPDIAEHHLELIKKAYDSNERQIAIVNSLLKVAQVDNGKVKLRMGECNVKQLLENIVEEFADTFRLKKQSIDLILDNAGVVVTADCQHLRMALENLISNASKYTYAYGSIDIHVTTEDSWIKIAIADNGVGIAAQDMKNLFEKFKRIPNDLSDEVGGTGLGLYWANKVVQLHGGRIEVTSVLNEGTTFTVVLPREEA